MNSPGWTFRVRRLAPRRAAPSPVVARGAKVEKLAGGFFNISGGAVGPRGDFYFVDAHWQRIYRWDSSSRQLSTVSDYPLEPVNLAVDQAGNLMVISYAGDGVVYALTPSGKVTLLKPEAVANWSGKSLYLPVSDWHLNRDSLSHPAADFISPDGTAVIPAGRGFSATAQPVGASNQARQSARSAWPGRAGPAFLCHRRIRAEDLESRCEPGREPEKFPAVCRARRRRRDGRLARQCVYRRRQYFCLRTIRPTD